MDWSSRPGVRGNNSRCVYVGVENTGTLRGYRDWADKSGPEGKRTDTVMRRAIHGRKRC